MGPFVWEAALGYRKRWSVRGQHTKPDSSSSKAPDLIAAAIGPQRTAYCLRCRLIFALLGTLIAVFSVTLFLGGEAQAQGTLDTGQPVSTLDTVGNSGSGAQAPVAGGGGPTYEANASSGGGEAIAPVQEEAAPLKQQTAPTQDLRSTPQSDPVYGQTAPAQEQITPVQEKAAPLKQQAQPVYDQAALIQERPAPVREQVTEPVQQKVEPIAEPVKQTVEPVNNTAKEIADPAVKPVTDTVNEITKPVLDTVSETARPVVEPVRETVEPVLDPVKDTAEPVVKPVVDEVDETVKPVVDPVKETVDPVAKPVIDPARDTVGLDPVAAAAPSQQSERVAGPTLDPVLGAEGSPVVAPVLEEGGAVLAPSAPVYSSALAVAKGVSLGAFSETAPAGRVPFGGNNLKGFPSNGLTGDQPVLPTPTTSGHPAVAPLFLVGEHPSILDFATRMYGTSTQLPQPLPLSGALPAVGSTTGGSAPGSASAGLDLGGVLTVLLIALLGGKFLWHAREFLKPTSVFQLVVNQPG